MTIAITNVLKLNVVGSETAEEIGSVKGFVFDRSGRRVNAVTVSDGLLGSQQIAWDRINAIGPDAVLVSIPATDRGNTDTDGNTETAAATGDDNDRPNIEYIGATVLTTDGANAGTVADVHVDESDGTVSAIMTTEGRVDGSRIRSLGSFAAVIDI